MGFTYVPEPSAKEILREKVFDMVFQSMFETKHDWAELGIRQAISCSCMFHRFLRGRVKFKLARR